jgi:hypothetical protein
MIDRLEAKIVEFESTDLTKLQYEVQMQSSKMIELQEENSSIKKTLKEKELRERLIQEHMNSNNFEMLLNQKRTDKISTKVTNENTSLKNQI